MAGYCFRYRDKLVIHTSGMGDPEYIFSVHNKKDIDSKTGICLKGIHFGYNTKEEKNKAIIKLNQYIKEHYDELCECDSSCPGFTSCKNIENIK